MGWGTSFGSDLWHALNLCLSCGYVTPRVTPFAQTHPLKPWQKKEWCIPPEQNAAFVCHMEDVVALHLTACHYPKLCSLGAIRTPSTKACKVFIPCQSVCHPGKPSLVRLRCPPKRPMARATSRTVPSVRPDFWRKTSSSRGLKPAWAASASGCLRRRSRSSIRRRATTRMLATAANSLSALANGSLSAPSPVLLAL